MSKETVNDFVVETNGHCFICLDSLLSGSSSTIVKEDGDPSIKPMMIHSLQCLSQFLKVDRKKVFIGEESIHPPQLIDKVEQSRLMVGLCEECAFLNKTFLRLYRKQEQIRMEVLSSVNSVYEKFKDTDIKKAGHLQNLIEEAEHNSTSTNLKGKLEVADVLRKETIQQCSRKLSKAGPKTKVNRLTGKDIFSAKLSAEKNIQGELHHPISDLLEVKLEVEHEDSMEVSQDEMSNCLDSFGDSEQPDFATGNEPAGDQDQEGHSHDMINLLDLGQNPEANLKRADIANNAFRTDSGGFKCRICEKEFSNSGSFFRHFQSTHLNVRFQCTLCDSVFTQKISLKTHYQSVHLKQQFNCEFCSKVFSSSSNRAKHWRLGKCPARKQTEAEQQGQSETR